MTSPGFPRVGHARQRGVTLIEVLVTVIVTLIGLLGVIALQMRAYATESESYQRAQAAILLEDIANRIRANKEDADAYVVVGALGDGAVESCAGAATIAARDLCEWENLLRGAAETYDGNTVGAMLMARGCITKPNAAVDQYVVAVAWQGTVSTANTAVQCGAGLYGAGLHRGLSTVVRIPDLG